MFKSNEKLLEEAMRSSGIGKGGLRWYDPPGWSTFTPEQRKGINEWFYSMVDQVDEWESVKRKDDENNAINASYFALIPFAAATAYKHSGFTSVFRFLFSFAASYLIYMLVFYIFSSVYTGLIVPKFSTSRTASVLLVCFGALLTVIITLLVSMRVFG